MRLGKVIATKKPPYGYRYNETRDGLVIYEPEAIVVEKISRLAAKGHGTRAIQIRLYREGVPSPTGKEVWHRPVLKRMILSDTYKPHTYKEALAVVPKEVGATLEKNKEYGIRWWNRSSQKSRQISEPTRNGQRHYRRKVTFTSRGQEEWIAAPVPAFLPRELVESARARMNTPRTPVRKNLSHGWELRGLMRCPSCGGAMTTHTAKRGEKLYHYYRCHRSVDYGRNSCNQRMERAQKAEKAMWEFVSRVMKDPGKIAVGMDALIEQKRAAMHGDPTREAMTWLEKLSEVDQERRGYQRLAAKGHMTEEELNQALLELEEIRQSAERELEALRHRQEEVEALERDRDAIKASWSAAVPGDLDRLTPEGRNTLYHLLRLEISPREGGYEITGPFVTGPFCASEPLSLSTFRNHTLSEPGFRAVLTQNGTQQVSLVRA